MSEPITPPDATPSAERPGARRLPAWAWVVIAVLVAALVAIAVMLGVSAASPGASTSPTPTETATPSATATETAAPTPTPTAVAGLDADMVENFLAALNSGNTAVFVQGGHFSDPILVVGAASGLNQQMSAVDAVHELDPLLSVDVSAPWQLASADDIALYRTGTYAQYFPDGAIVVKSTEDHVISFIGSGRIVTTLFFAMVTESLVG